MGTYGVGNLFYGADGWAYLDEGTGFKVYKGEKSELVTEIKPERGKDTTILHFENFLAACRSRNYKELTAEIEIGAASVMLVHMANISYRVGKSLTWDDAKKNFGDPAANKLMTRDYRRPYVV